MNGPTLFPDLVPLTVEPSEPGEKLSADRRRTLRQRADVERGRHPLTGGRLSSDADARCGNCRFRQVFRYHNRSYGKCVFGDGMRITHSAASDVRAWWPACTDHEWGDSGLSPDAARSGPRRIQLRRTKGWRKPEGVVVVGRPSRWGNPFRIGQPDPLYGWPMSRAESVQRFREWLGRHPIEARSVEIQLAGRDLACWCPLDQPCHADVLLEIANEGLVS